MSAKLPVLGIDLGGTKTLLGLVRGSVCESAVRIATPATDDPHRWLDALEGAASAFRGQYGSVGIAVSGLVADGCWWAVNPLVLPVPAGFPLVAELQRRLGAPVHAVNDGQAAAWGEYRFGAGQGCDLVFITVSTGVGGGIVLDGRLRTGHRGLAGHVGQYRGGETVATPIVEDCASGTAIAAGAAALGHKMDAAGVFAAAADGESWAETLLERLSGRLAAALATLQSLLDPDCIVIGGGVGLAPGYVDRLRRHLAGLSDLLRPELRTAALGAQAGLLGAADYSVREPNKAGEET